MWTHTLRNGFVACSLACALGAAGPPLSAQGDSTHVTRPGARFPRGVVGVGWGRGSLELDCEACPDASAANVKFVEGEIGFDPVRAVGLVLTGGMSDARSGDFNGGAAWWLVGARFRPGASGRFFLQAAAGKAGVGMQRRIGEDTGLCKLIFGDCWDVDVLEMSSRVYQFVVGFEVPLSRHVALTPRLQAVAGKVTLTGLSLGISAIGRNE